MSRTPDSSASAQGGSLHTPDPSGRRRWLFGGVALAAAGAGGWVAWRHTQQDNANNAAIQAFWALQLQQPDGAALALASLKGTPLLVNFWATWCPPCVRELPMLDRFALAQSANRLQVLGIAVDQAPAVQKWLARQPLSFPVAMAGAGGIALTRSLGNIQGGLPFTLLLDAEGRVQQRKIGELSEQELLQWVSAI